MQILCVLFLQGTISVGIDATDLFDRYEEDFEEMPGGGGGFPHVEINRMHISQSVEVSSHMSTMQVEESSIYDLMCSYIPGPLDYNGYSRPLGLSHHAQR